MESPCPMRPKKAHEKQQLFITYAILQILVCIVVVALTNLIVGMTIATLMAVWRYPILLREQDKWISISDEEFAADPEAQRAYHEWHEKFLASLTT